MRLITFLLSALLFALPVSAKTIKLGDRYYEVMLPANPRGASLILALHGGGGNPDQFASASGFGRAAVKAGYVVALPAGSGRRGDSLLTWNGGYCCGFAQRRQVDDSAFLSAVIKDAQDRFGVDGKRVYITGMSNRLDHGRRALRHKILSTFVPLQGSRAQWTPTAPGFGGRSPPSSSTALRTRWSRMREGRATPA